MKAYINKKTGRIEKHMLIANNLEDIQEIEVASHEDFNRLKRGIDKFEDGKIVKGLSLEEKLALL